MAEWRDMPSLAAMIQEDWLQVRMSRQKTNQFRPAVSAVSDNSDPLHV